MATVYAVPPIWTVSIYLAHIIGEIAIQANSFEDVLTRINKLLLR